MTFVKGLHFYFSSGLDSSSSSRITCCYVQRAYSSLVASVYQLWNRQSSIFYAYGCYFTSHFVALASTFAFSELYRLKMLFWASHYPDCHLSRSLRRHTSSTHLVSCVALRSWWWSTIDSSPLWEVFYLFRAAWVLLSSRPSTFLSITGNWIWKMCQSRFYLQ